MGKKLAIKGHATRGEEVIELLEMLGGRSNCGVSGSIPHHYYYLNTPTYIDAFAFESDFFIRNKNNFAFYTLEEFLEKYPFKVRDKVFLYDNITEGCVTGMKWDEDKGTVKYCVYTSAECWCNVEELLKWNPIDLAEKHYEKQCEEMNETQTKENDVRKIGYTLNELIDLVPLTSDSVMIVVREGFEIIEEQGKFFLKKKKPKYPTTYEDCCEVLNYCGDYFLTTYDNNGNPSIISNILNSINILTKLLICRDAYWKIAGEEMGLQPWKPDWTNETTKYGIRTYQNTVIKDNVIRTNCAFVFPTLEIRDIFYENFKDLIESCKELL